jgi:hypothetical protein
MDPPSTYLPDTWSGRLAASELEASMSDLLYLCLTLAAFGAFAALIRILDRL